MANVIRITKAQKLQNAIDLLNQLTEMDYTPIEYPAEKKDGVVVKEGVTVTAEYLIDFFQSEIEALQRKRSTERKPTAEQLKNAEYRQLILEYLAEQTEGKTADDMRKEIPEFAEEDFSNQKVTGLLRTMWNQGVNPTIRKEITSGKSYFFSL